MIAHINLDDRLSILRVSDPSKSWNSLDDQRICVLCERKFKGRQVDIRRCHEENSSCVVPRWVACPRRNSGVTRGRLFPLMELKPIGGTMGLTKRDGARMDQHCECKL